MNKKIRLVFIFLFISNILCAQWHVINISTTQVINSIYKSGSNYFIGGNKGFVSVLDSNFNLNSFISTPTGNDDWTEFSVIEPNYYYIFCKPNPGYGTQIFSTNDKGKNWDMKLYIDTLIGSEFKMFDSLNGIILCSYRKSLITNDGGNTWYSVVNNIFPPISSCKFGDSIICTGLQSSFGWSTNKGLNWKFNKSDFQSGSAAMNFHYVNPSTVMSVSWSPVGYFYSYSINSGLDWTHKFFTAPYDIYPSDLYFESVSTGIVVGEKNGFGTIFMTTDSGNTWKPVITDINTIFTRIEKANDSIYLIGGTNGVLISWNKNSIRTGMKQSINSKSIKIFPNPCIETQTIEFSGYGENIVCSLISADDKIISEKVLSNFNNILIFDFSDLPKGIYFYKIKCNDGIYYFKTLK